MKKIKVCAGWDSNENILKRLVEQFDTGEGIFKNIEFVFDNSYDVIVYNNYITEEPKKDSKALIFFHEPSWSGNHQKSFSNYKNLTVFGYHKNLYSFDGEILETPSCLFYGGRGPWCEGWDFWNYENLMSYNFEKTKNISSVVSSLGNDNSIYTEGCLYRERANIIKKVINNCSFIDIFGWGKNGKNLKGELREKKHGLLDYRFSICIENSNEKNYISEKFFDCILTNTIPIYFGCNNIKELIPEEGYFLIKDINNELEILNLLNYISNNSDTIYEKMLPELFKIKEKFFNEFNLLKKIIKNSYQ